MTKMADRDGTTQTLNRTSRQGLPWNPGDSFLSSVSLAGGNSVAVGVDSDGHLTGFTPTNNVGPTAGPVTYSYETQQVPTSSPTATRTASTGRLTKIQVTNVAGGTATTTFTYNTAHDLASVTDPAGNLTTFTYDSSHRVTAVAQGNGSDQATTRFQYFSATNAWTDVATPTSDQSVSAASAAHTIYDVDANKLVSKATDALGHRQLATYTPQSDVASSTNGVNGKTTNTYGANSGNSMTSSKSPTGSGQSWAYGNTGNSAYQPSTGADSQGNRSSYGYSTTGAAQSNKNGSNDSSSLTYHADGNGGDLDRPGRKADDLHRIVDGAVHHQDHPTQRNRDGRHHISQTPATSFTNGAGETTTYSYDGLYHVTKQSSPSGTINYGYDANGRTTSRQDPNQTTTYAYNSRGDLTSLTTTATTSSATSSKVSYGYDLNGNMTSRTVNGNTTTYTYNSVDKLTSMTTQDGAVTRFAYDADNRRTDTWWHTSADHTQFAAHTHTVFDTSGRTTQSWTALNNDDTNKVVDYSYSFAKAGVDTGLVQSITNNLASSNKVTTLAYDKSNRLTSATNWDGHDYTYTYDHNGNRLTASGGASNQTLTYNADNQISSSGYAYDKAGRRTTDPAAGTMTWNSMGQMTKQTLGSHTDSFVYAGSGQNEMTRQSADGGQVDYVYGRSNQAGIPVWEQYKLNGTVATFDNDSNGQPVDYQGGGQDYYMIYTGIGAWAGTSLQTGQLNGLIQFDPWGVQETSTSSTSSQKNKLKTQASSAGSESPWTTIGISNQVVPNFGYWKRGARWNERHHRHLDQR